MLETLTTIIGFAIGPAGGVVILVVILFGVYRMTNDKLFPMLSKYLTDMNQQIKDIMAAHEKDRDAYLEGISSVNKRLDTIDGKLEDIEDRLPKKRYREESTGT